MFEHAAADAATVFIVAKLSTLYYKVVCLRYSGKGSVDWLVSSEDV